MAITLAQLIREARLREGPMSQGELGKRAGTTLENITSIENERNRQPKPDILSGLAKALHLRNQDIYDAIMGSLNHFPWERVGDLDLKDPELELMFKQVDGLLEGEAKEQVKAFIKFTLDEDRKRKTKEKDTKEGKR